MSKHIRIQWAQQPTPVDIEYQWVGVNSADAPIMVFLHEGLGSVKHWGKWPEQLCQQLGYKGLVYSRYAYGNSSPRPEQEQWQSDYLHIQAQHALPALLTALGIDKTQQPIHLFGHSDGATIALLYAALPDTLAQSIIVLAPHLYIEEKTQAGVQKAMHWYQAGDLKQRLAVYHADPDSAFWGWANAWGNPDVLQDWNIENDIRSIQCPALVIQGTDDEYATLQQVYDTQKNVPHAKICILEQCRHSPHIDMPETIIKEVKAFLATQN